MHRNNINNKWTTKVTSDNPGIIEVRTEGQGWGRGEGRALARAGWNRPTPGRERGGKCWASPLSCSGVVLAEDDNEYISVSHSVVGVMSTNWNGCYVHTLVGSGDLMPCAVCSSVSKKRLTLWQHLHCYLPVNLLLVTA